MNRYSEKLRDPRWQKKRLEIMQRDAFKCLICGDCKTTLHVHHKEYQRGKEPWEYEDDNFQTLCKHCHALLECLKKHNVITPIKSVLVFNAEEDYSGLAVNFVNGAVGIFRYLETSATVEILFGFGKNDSIELSDFLKNP